MCIPDTDHLNGNLLLNKENWENLMSAGKLPETDSRMKTLKYCVTQPMLEVPSVATYSETPVITPHVYTRH